MADNDSGNTHEGVWHAIGPGILFAGAAVGVSHLVQSTRAGANFGFALLAFVIIANFIKYPAFRFGQQYAAATGTSMLEGYRRRGKWALGLYAALTLGTMFTVQGAVTFVTAALGLYLFGWDVSPLVASGVLMGVCAGLLVMGRYAWLDRVVKVAVVVFTIATLAAAIVAAGRAPWSGPWFPDFGAMSPPELMFIAALIGWMPSAIDISIWQSLWTLARARDSGKPPSVRAAMIDFHVGYIGTAVLALCFVLLGAAIMHNSGREIPAQPVAFAGALVDLYTETLGGWTRPLIAASAFMVMFSTTFTVTDGFPRAIDVLVQRWREPEATIVETLDDESQGRGYWAGMAMVLLGTFALLAFAVQSLKGLVDVATTLSFLTAPVLSWLNHAAMMGDEVPNEGRPRGWLWGASWVGIAVQAIFALAYLYLRFGASA